MSINMPNLQRRRIWIVFECNPAGNKMFHAGFLELQVLYGRRLLWYD